MTDTSIVIERRYRAALDQLWALWTTSLGIESWWGPPGFTVTVQEMNLMPGGILRYTMTATDPQMAAFMTLNGMPVATSCQVIYGSIMPMSRLTYRNLVDFVPGHAPYHTGMAIDFEQQGDAVLLRLTFDPMHDAVWTERQRMGWEQQLGKLRAMLPVSG